MKHTPIRFIRPPRYAFARLFFAAPAEFIVLLLLLGGILGSTVLLWAAR